MKLIKKNSIIILGILVALLIITHNSFSTNRVAVTAKTKVAKNAPEVPSSKTLNVVLDLVAPNLSNDNSNPSQASDANFEVLTIVSVERGPSKNDHAILDMPFDCFNGV